jgi:hypothetical protein
MPGYKVTPLATQPGSATTEPPLGWSSKLLIKKDFFYSGPDTAAGKRGKNVQK